MKIGTVELETLPTNTSLIRYREQPTSLGELWQPFHIGAYSFEVSLPSLNLLLRLEF
jgi:hypothetical protein